MLLLKTAINSIMTFVRIYDIAHSITQMLLQYEKYLIGEQSDLAIRNHTGTKQTHSNEDRQTDK